MFTHITRHLALALASSALAHSMHPIRSADMSVLTDAASSWRVLHSSHLARCAGALHYETHNSTPHALVQFKFSIRFMSADLIMDLINDGGRGGRGAVLVDCSWSLYMPRGRVRTIASCQRQPIGNVGKYAVLNMVLNLNPPKSTDIIDEEQNQNMAHIRLHHVNFKPRQLTTNI